MPGWGVGGSSSISSPPPSEPGVRGVEGGSGWISLGTCGEGGGGVEHVWLGGLVVLGWVVLECRDRRHHAHAAAAAAARPRCTLSRRTMTRSRPSTRMAPALLAVPQ